MAQTIAAILVWTIIAASYWVLSFGVMTLADVLWDMVIRRRLYVPQKFDMVFNTIWALIITIWLVVNTHLTIFTH